MKKRLLSAALALAMVLTLLPVSVFAVEYQTPTKVNPDSKKYTVNGVEKSFYEKDGNRVTSTVTVARATSSDPTTGREEGKWYWLDDKNDKDKPIYHWVQDGIVAGTSGSGQWYSSVADYDNAAGDKVNGAFTILSTNYACDLSTYKDTSLTIDLNGNTGTVTVPRTLTSLTLTNKFTTNQGGVNAITTARTSYDGATGGDDGTKTGLTITATGVQIGAITLKGRGNTVTLNDCSVTGAISMDGTFNSDSKDTNKKSYPAQRLTINGGSITTGGIKVTGDGSTVTVNGTKMAGQDILFEGNSGTISVSGDAALQSIHPGAREATGNYPTVNISGGNVNGGVFRADVSDNDKELTVNISGGTTKVGLDASGGIVASRGKVTVDRATVGPIMVNGGSVTINGNSTKTGAITIGNEAPVNLSINSNSTNLDISGITSTNTKLTIGSWPTNRDNKYGTISLGDYAGHGVKGGTFNSSMNWTTDTVLPWLSTDLQFAARTAGDQPWKLYGKTELGRAISDVGTATLQTENMLIIVGQMPNNHITLMNGNTVWGKIGFGTDSSIVLPEEINGVKIKSWIGPNGKPVPAGTAQTILAGNITLNATDVVEDVTKLTNVSINTSASDNRDIRVALNGNNISLSGAIKAGAGGLAIIRLDLTTDVVDTDGDPIVFKNVPVEYDVSTKTLKFNEWATVGNEKYGATVEDGKLKLANGTVYTVTNGGLNVSASDLGLHTLSAGKSIVATVGGTLSSMKDDEKAALIKKFTEGTCHFSFTGNKAMAEAINAAQATITSVDGLVDRAQQYVWTNGNSYKDNNGKPNGLGAGNGTITKHSGNITAPGKFKDDANTIKDLYSQAYIVPYLVVNVTDYNQNGTLTATLTPYYRVDVSKKGAYSETEYYTIQTGRAMSALTGDMSTPIEVTFALDSAFNDKYIHQDGKYVYQGDTQTWKISHAGTNGLGTIVINDQPGPISITTTINPRTPSLPACTYDTLQAAVDDTVPGAVDKKDPTKNTYDTIKVGGKYTGSCAVNMTGLARTIKVNFEGNHDVVTGQGATKVQELNGFEYTITLERDTVVSKTNITISSATGGSASVSKNPASVGDKVTITLSASAGYSPSGVSVKTSSGQSVSVSGSGSSYTFTMPSGSVTVTPSFTKIQVVNPTVSVGGASSGIGTASTNTSGQVAPGTTVTVTTSPGVGQRTMGINVTGATAIRTGANTFQFSVPSGYTNVVVTPKFDVNNGTLFEDVWSTEYYSNPVRWAVERGVTNGESTYRFGSGNSCTREQMVTFLYRAAGSPAVGNVNNPFWDVRAGEYYYNAVMWAVSKGITNGVSANQFGVGQPVTRAQAVTFLYRYEGSPAASTNSGFYDVNSREYYAKAVSWANAKGVTNGTTATTFSPNDYCLRAQIVTFLYRDMTGNRA